MATPHYPKAKVITRQRSMRSFPLCDETLACLCGLSLDDYTCYLLAVWLERQPVSCRRAWRNYLRANHFSIGACDRLLAETTNPGYLQAMTFFLWFSQKRGRYRGSLTPTQIKVLAQGLGQTPQSLAGKLGMPEDLTPPWLMKEEYPTPLAERMAIWASRNNHA